MGSYKKILIYGRPYKWGIPYNLKEAFQRVGYKADIFDWTQYLQRTKKYNLKNRILDRILISNTAKKINLSLTSSFKKGKYDLLIVLNGLHLFSETITKINKEVPVVNWNLDDFFNPRNNSKYMLKAFDKYDCIFTQRRHLIEEYYKKGAKRVEPLSCCYIPEFLYPENLSTREIKVFGSDIVFIGTWSRRREEILYMLQDFNLKIWGSHWNRANKRFHRNISCSAPIFADDMRKAIIASKINLNILTIENRDTTNLRNFEISACAGFQLTERSKEIQELFEEDTDITCFETVEELISKSKYYLEHESERERIRLNGHKRLVNGNHTIMDRADQILRVAFNE